MFHMHRIFPGPRHGRLFRRGDLKYVILDLVKEQPRHGYDIIRALEEHTRGFYTPSPGVVYPTLQLLEEMGYVTCEQQEGKKVYTITEDGLEFLAKRGKRADDIKRQMAEWWDLSGAGETRDAWHRYREIGHLLRRSFRGATAEELDRVHQIIAKAHRDIEDILKD